ncbi:hypothetical protein HZS_7849, partial [Henneguya salminicola]
MFYPTGTKALIVGKFPYVFTRGYDRYFGMNTLTENDLKSLLESDMNICEYISHNRPLRLFFDIETKKEPHESSTYDIKKCNILSILYVGTEIVNKLCNTLSSIFPDKVLLYYKSTSHIYVSDVLKKYSMHIVVHIIKHDGTEVLFHNMRDLKAFLAKMSKITECAMVDTSVYREKGGLLRTINQSKMSERRPMMMLSDKDNFSDHMVNNLIINNNIEEYTEKKLYDINIISNSALNHNPSEILSSEWTKLTVLDFLKKWYSSLNQSYIKLHAIKLNDNNKLYTLYKGFCMFINNYHKSNNQTLMISHENITFECLDVKCHGKKITVKSSNFMSEETLKLLLVDNGISLVRNIIKKIDTWVKTITQTSNICFEALCSPQLETSVKNQLSESPNKYKHVVSTVQHEIQHNSTGSSINISKVDLNLINNFCFNVNNFNVNNNINQKSPTFENNEIITRTKTTSFKIISASLLNEQWLSLQQKDLLTKYFEFPVTTTLVELFFLFFDHTIIYSDGVYYKYSDDCYKMIKHNADLMANFESNIENLFNKIKSCLELKNISKEHIDKLLPLYNSLNSQHTKNKLLTYIISNFSCDSLTTKLDNEINLIPFKSNYYCHKRRSFFNYSKDVYITKKLSYDITLEEDETDVMGFLNSIFPDPQLLRMMLQILASALIPLEPPRLLLIAFCLEPSKQKLCSSMVKKLCGGGDTIVCRPLYSNTPIYFKNIATMMVACNDIITFDEVDEAMASRMIIIPFMRIFVSHPKHKNERLIDYSISNKIYDNENYKKGLMSHLIKMLMTLPLSTGIRIDIAPNTLNFQNTQQESLARFELWLRDHICSGTKQNVLKFKTIYDNYITYLCCIGDIAKYRECLARFHNYIQLTKENYPLTTFGCHRDHNKE